MANTLYEYYTQQGQNLPSVSERASVYQNLGLGNASEYKGTIAQNALLLSRLGSSSAPAANNKNTPVATKEQNTGPTKNYAPYIQNSIQNPIDATTQASLDAGKTNEQNYNAIINNGGKLPADQEEAIRAAKRAALQSQIDAINLASQDMIAKFRNTLGKERVGQTYALAAAGGRIGSATGEAEVQNTQNENAQTENEYRNQANLQISALIGKVNSDAMTESQNRIAAIQAGHEAYVKNVSTATQRKSDALKTFVKGQLINGLSLSQIIDAYDNNKDLQDKVLNTYGAGRNDLITAYNEAKMAQDQVALENKKTQAELDKNNTFTLNEGDARYTVDPVTGKATLIAARAKTPSGSNGGMSGNGTNLNYSDPNYTLNAIKNSKGGRLMTQSELKPITDIQQVIGQSEVLTSLINTVDTGPIVGIVKSNNPYDTKAQEMKAAITAIVPKLARGIYGEVGVLTDSDINNYSKTIANLKSTSDVNKAVMAMTLDIATRSLANQLNTQAAGGRDVSRFESIYTGLNEKANKIKNELGITEQAPAAPVDATTQGLRDKYKY